MKDDFTCQIKLVPQLRLNSAVANVNYDLLSITALQCNQRQTILLATLYREWTVGPLSSATCPPIFQRFYWPENAIDWPEPA